MDFHTTSWTVVLEAADSRGAQAGEALDGLLRAYWRPLYSLARIRGRNHHDAEDAVQAFFATFVERRTVKRADRERGRFRTFLQVAFQNFLINEWQRAQTLKRGGGAESCSLEELPASGRAGALAAAPEDPAAAFDREWAAVLLDRAMQRLRSQFEADGDAQTFALLNPYLERTGSAPEYEQAGQTLGISGANVKTRVFRLRGEFRRVLRAEVAATVTDPHEIDEELGHLRQVLAR